MQCDERGSRGALRIKIVSQDVWAGQRGSWGPVQHVAWAWHAQGWHGAGVDMSLEAVKHGVCAWVTQGYGAGGMSLEAVHVWLRAMAAPNLKPRRSVPVSHLLHLGTWMYLFVPHQLKALC